MTCMQATYTRLHVQAEGRLQASLVHGRAANMPTRHTDTASDSLNPRCTGRATTAVATSRVC